MPPSGAPSSTRDARIDALRGFALLGILLVNIQSFLYGASNPIGYLQPDSELVDRAVYFATAAFVSLKFMPLFAMLFGAGFSLLYLKLEQISDQPKRIYRRRMAFLFVFGVLHGVLFYFGDITNMYALAGFVLLAYVDGESARIGRAALGWWVGATIFNLLVLLVFGQAAPSAKELAPVIRSNFEAFVTLNYVEQLAPRAGEFWNVVFGNLFGFPMTVALMLTGMWAHRAGLLRNRGARAWNMAAWLGLVIGLPAGLLFGYYALTEAIANGLGATTVGATIPQLISVTLTFFYAATFLRYAPEALVRILAPAGRMPLTNYCMQSVAMGALLSGWGLALGPRLDYAQTAGLALLIFTAQVVLSAWWLGRANVRQGPLEALWRAWTYRNLSARSAA